MSSGVVLTDRKERPRAARSLLLVAILLGIVIRVGVLFAFGTQQPIYEYRVIGSNLAHGRGFSFFAETPTGIHTQPLVGTPQPGAYVPPIYAVISAAADKATGGGSGEVRVLQGLNLLLFAVMALLLFELGTALLGAHVGGLVALGLALYPPLVYMTSQVSPSNLYLPAEAGLLLAVVWLLRTTSRRDAIVAGALGGLVCLLRPEGVILVVILAAFVVRAARRSGKSGMAAFRPAALLLVVAVAPVAVWLVRNSITMGRPTPTVTTQAGFVLWAGNHDGATGSGKTYTVGAAAVAKETALLDRVNHLPPGRDYEIRRDAVFRHEALSWMSAHPAATVVGLAKKTFLLGAIDRDDRRSLNPGYLLSWAGLVVLAGLGLLRLRPRGPEWTLIGLYAAISFVVPVVAVVLPRYRLPVDMVALLPAGWLVAQSSAY
nr:glycosyltransferase family 39 protein [Actinomycetota bacterium]